MIKKTYVFMLSDEDRKRHEHIREKNKVLGFVIQYEILIEGEWKPVVRYDTAHGYAHKDMISPDGSVEKVFLGISDLRDALTLADEDINRNWERYKHRYLRRIKG